MKYVLIVIFALSTAIHAQVRRPIEKQLHEESCRDHLHRMQLAFEEASINKKIKKRVAKTKAFDPNNPGACTTGNFKDLNLKLAEYEGFKYENDIYTSARRQRKLEDDRETPISDSQ